LRHGDEAIVCAARRQVVMAHAFRPLLRYRRCGRPDKRIHRREPGRSGPHGAVPDRA
jgi:hypothetical protein